MSINVTQNKVSPSWRVVLLTSLIAFFAILAGFFGFAFWGNQNYEIDLGYGEISMSADEDLGDVTWYKPFDENEIEEVLEVQMTEEAWQNFDSRKLPVTFDYPADWKIWEGTTPLSDYIQIADYTLEPQEDDFTGEVPGHKLEITLIELPLEQPLEQWIKETNSNFFDIASVTKDVLVDGFPAKLDYIPLAKSTFATVYIPLGDGTDNIITISLFGPEADPLELESLLLKILATVRVKG